MIKRLATTASAVACAVALTTGLTACAGGSSELPAPEFVTSDNLDGAEITLHPDRSLVIPVGEDDPARWSEGSVDDEAVAKFVPGTSAGETKSNPGFTAVGKGTTGAQIVDPKTGEAITFTITVK
ncbi:hypothetical protein JKI95_10275 [Corynebacterium aquatimens]|uniref:hypothetical protein n=1 Tax=Corynebacterium TaxID=1716 RepID=UPI001F1860E2|nr:MULTISPECIES: hypothetical protein [Corynebacterium]QYH19456.1 hypothetical protein JKI95_10275 [Corynebacterium aquatimens]UIZ91626.1 hypothetical protein JZY91_07685 [Corynebacterium sp. CNCTC7651]